MKILQGIDLVKIARVETAVRKDGKRFLDKVFTPAEQAYCEARKMRFEHYAARLAAKDALLKALKIKTRTAGGLCGIEVRREPSGKPYFFLSSEVRKKAAIGPRDQVELSVAHERDYAIATVVVVKP